MPATLAHSRSASDLIDERVLEAVLIAIADRTDIANERERARLIEGRRILERELASVLAR
jgi:metal-dependent HD superfamily phosphatase/phosphodiesterase